MKLNIDFIYPLGSIYMSSSPISPEVLFGGKWTQIKDRFLLGCGDTYNNGEIGGEATHQLTIEEMPSHTHSAKADALAQNGTSRYVTDISGKLNASVNNNTGGNQPHNNMPPYRAVYIWERTA